jgi:hypothetical protein
MHLAPRGILHNQPQRPLGVNSVWKHQPVRSWHTEYLRHLVVTIANPMRTEYPAKILLAWGEAIGGHRELRDWLIKNGYPELGIFTFALRNKKDAREWLMKNGHPHLMALITGIEGDKNALAWLEHHGMNVLKQVALCGDNNDDAFHWLRQRGHHELAMLALRMRKVKNEIEEDNKDPHKYRKE